MAEEISGLIAAKHGQGVRVVDVVIASASSTATVTFDRAYRNTPQVVSVFRQDGNTSQTGVPRVSTLSPTQVGLTLPANASSEHTYKVVVVGEYAN